MLILAAATGAEAGAAWLDAVGRRLEDLEEIRLRVGLVVAIDACTDFFARQAEGDKDDPFFVAITCDPLSEVR